MRKPTEIGARYGRLVVLSEIGTVRDREVVVRVRCDCGNERDILRASLRRGSSTSCGCFGTEQRTKAATTHGESQTSLYKVWHMIRLRCNDATHPSYHKYGGRGVQMHADWTEDYPAFATAIRTQIGPRPSKRHSLDRIDNDGHYEPGNLRWATPSEQGRNTRHNHLLTYSGRTMSVAAWAEAMGMPHGTLHQRIRMGWPIEKCLTEPVKAAYRRRGALYSQKSRLAPPEMVGPVAD